MSPLPTLFLIRSRLPVLLFLAGSLAPLFALATELEGKVVGISDGDTLTLLTSTNVQVKVRLAEIDAPESGQPWSQRAKQTLSEIVFGKSVRMRVLEIDRTSDTVGRIFVGSLDVSAEMVRRGDAWVYRQYSRDRGLVGLERIARVTESGLWSLPEAQRQEPSEWRREQKRHASSPTP